MANSGGVIKGPISLIDDVYSVLGLGPHNGGFDLAYACSNQHGKITDFARYRPVALGLTPINPDTITGNANGKFWAENNISAAQSRPWFWGKYSARAIKAPTISSVSDVLDGDGNVKDSAKWTFNYPVPGTDYCRITDFLGYNHDAEPPFYGWVTPGDIGINEKIRVGFSFFHNDSGDPLGKIDGCWGAQELVDYLGAGAGGGAGMYLGVVIRNRTQNIIRSGTIPDKIKFTDTDTSWVRELDMQSQSPIYYGGVGHKPNIGDELDIFVYLTSSVVTDNGIGQTLGGNGLSLYMNDEHPASCKKTVVSTTVVIQPYNIKYDWRATRSYAEEFDNFGRVYYINTIDMGGSEEQIFQVEHYYANVGITGLHVELSADNSSTELGIATQGNRKTLVRFGAIYEFNSSEGNFEIGASRLVEFYRTSNINKGLDTSWAPSNNTVLYTSYNDAVARNNGVEISSIIKAEYQNAIPIPSKLMTSASSSAAVSGSIKAFVVCIPQYNNQDWNNGLRLQGTSVCKSPNNIDIGSI